MSRTAIKSLGKIPKKKSTTTGSECSSNGGRKPPLDDVAVAESVIELDAADQQMGEDAMRAMWLRKVETRPADFLAVRFNYQLAKQENASSEALREAGNE